MEESDFRNSLPAAVTSRFRTQVVNAPVILFDGTAIITETDGPTERQVVIVHEWTPSPVLVCRYSCSGKHAFHGNISELHKPIAIEIPALGLKTETRYYDGQSCGDKHRHGLAILRGVEINPGTAMSRIVFHVINCCNMLNVKTRITKAADKRGEPAGNLSPAK
jgi:hypothetical protein